MIFLILYKCCEFKSIVLGWVRELVKFFKFCKNSNWVLILRFVKGLFNIKSWGLWINVFVNENCILKLLEILF